MSIPPSCRLGSVIRGARSALRMTQAQLGQACGYSASAVSRVEAGMLRPTEQALLLIAEALDLSPADLGLVYPARALSNEFGRAREQRATLAGHVTQSREAAVLRRQLLAGMAGAGASLLTAPVAVSETVPDTAARIEGALYVAGPAAPVALEQLRRTLFSARVVFNTAGYRALAQTLPALLGAAEATRDASAGRNRDLAHACVARAYVLATELAVKEHADVAWATADRAVSAARASGSPAVLGEAARVLAITMRRAGRSAAAVDLLRRTASSLSQDAAAESQAVEATLLMTAAYTAACDRQRGDALDLMAGATDAVDRLAGAEVGAAGPLFTVDATSTQIDLYWIGVHTALGTPDQAVSHAARISPGRLPTAERRARYGTDCARMWHRLGDHRQTFAALRMVEQVAPEEVRRPALQALASDLLYAPVGLPGVREFARRTGAMAVDR
ncbi:helix-turn-helix domain-containing protein [Kitasatospora sp. NPDC048239]|uniref:helix-turn-helix domain-containing protein n=1 Tax=Kitasatospora sp. NPDC048239 TaxID=3364046 RepID=UPI003711CF07